MTDMLVKLFQLPLNGFITPDLRREGIEIRRAMVYEKSSVVKWVEDRFGAVWGQESEAGFCFQPVRCLIALHRETLIGFACHDVTYPNFFGPLGVDRNYRRQGVGRGLLLAALAAMAARGYAYGIIGNAGVPEFFSAVAGAVAIDDSSRASYPPPIGSADHES